MKDRRRLLKVKIKSLMAEARIIRKEEKKSKNDLRNELAEHRRTTVRNEARNTLIAYAFIRGKKYSDTEKEPKTSPDWNKIKKMIYKYGVCYSTNESWDSYRERQAAQIEEVDKLLKG